MFTSSQVDEERERHMKHQNMDIETYRRYFLDDFVIFSLACKDMDHCLSRGLVRKKNALKRHNESFRIALNAWDKIVGLFRELARKEEGLLRAMKMGRVSVSTTLNANIHIPSGKPLEDFVKLERNEMNDEARRLKSGTGEVNDDGVTPGIVVATKKADFGT